MTIFALPQRVNMLQCRPKKPDLIILGIFAGIFSGIYLFLWVAEAILGEELRKIHWTVGLIANILGYAAFFVPGYIIFGYVRGSGYSNISEANCLAPFVKICFFGSDDTLDESIDACKVNDREENKDQPGSKSERKQILHLLGCFLGLQLAYLTWGYLQEGIMTQKYVNTSGHSGMFTDSQFLVFVNRILAFAIALLYITFSNAVPRHKAPLYKYSFCSLSNIMSSWCQYEALKFVSFPMQVLAKASKVIPVMIMGRVVRKQRYQRYEYIVALMISFGMVLFLFGSGDTAKAKNVARESTDGILGYVNWISGFILLVGYLGTDAFTSNWQGKLFTSYKMHSVQMMAGVNLFSCIFTLTSLLQQGAFFSSLEFMSKFPKFAGDCVTLSICSGVGQILIYHTIDAFGPLAFTIIMTLRQAMAIILSCILYGHTITASGVFGVLIVFSAVLLKIYYSHRIKRLAAQSKKESTQRMDTQALNIEIGSGQQQKI
jgi:adenosine 3'-phospho 5'-phosphosulfate transporter B2